jgi:hypothetical protein
MFSNSLVSAIIHALVPVIAASGQSLSISNVPTSINYQDETTIAVQFTCPDCSTDSYLRGVFYPSGSNYFGYTQNNNGSWINASGSMCDLYYKISHDQIAQGGSWSGVLKVKPDPGNSFYNGPGNYTFKIGRYTPSCNSPSSWSNEVSIAITGPTPTPYAQPTATAMPTARSTQTPMPTSFPTSTLGVTATKKALATPKATPTSAILGVSDQLVTSTPNPVTPTPTGSLVKGAGGINPLAITLAFVGGGVGLLGAAMALKISKKWNAPPQSTEY